MIGRPTLSGLARTNGVEERAQEKDYILTWLLAARATLGPSTLAFKGGTALRRCYFADYRYSEDLDFTAEEAMSTKALAATIDDWCGWVDDQTGMTTARKVDAPARGGTFYVTYVGPLQARDGRDVKIDIATDESVRERNEARPLLSDYPDIPSGLHVETYGLPEIWAEKVRSLMQRSEPRDLYDLDHLLAHDSELPAMAVDLFRRKAVAKALDPETLHDRLAAREPVLERHWANRLVSQVPSLAEFDGAWRRVQRGLRQAGYLR